MYVKKKTPYRRFLSEYITFQNKTSIQNKMKQVDADVAPAHQNQNRTWSWAAAGQLKNGGRPGARGHGGRRHAGRPDPAGRGPPPSIGWDGPDAAGAGRPPLNAPLNASSRFRRDSEQNHVAANPRARARKKNFPSRFRVRQI